MKYSYLMRPLPWAIAALAVYWLALFIGTHLPNLAEQGVPEVNDKAAHYVGYLGLSFLLSAVVMRRSRWARNTAGLVATGVMLYGVADELLQIPVPGRTADVWDWVYDCLGTISGVIIFRVVQKMLMAHQETRRGAREVALERT
jgi:VanZ family protein